MLGELWEPHFTGSIQFMSRGPLNSDHYSLPHCRPGNTPVLHVKLFDAFPVFLPAHFLGDAKKIKNNSFSFPFRSIEAFDPFPDCCIVFLNLRFVFPTARSCSTRTWNWKIRDGKGKIAVTKIVSLIQFLGDDTCDRKNCGVNYAGKFRGNSPNNEEQWNEMLYRICSGEIWFSIVA